MESDVLKHDGHKHGHKHGNKHGCQAQARPASQDPVILPAPACGWVGRSASSEV